MSTSHRQPSWRPLLRACALACAAVLSACGPGVGGTGTGETPGALAYFGATAASVCSSDLANLLGCAPANAAAAPAPGVTTLYLADTIDGRRVAVSLQGNTIEISAPCAQLRFRGDWGAIGSQAARFFGYTDHDGPREPATVVAQTSGSSVALTVSGADGRILLGPVLVKAVAAPALPGSCGSSGSSGSSG